jgi:hypothetical protein
MLFRFVFLASISLFAAGFFQNSAAAQVVIPYGGYDSDFEKYLVVAVSLAALVFAVWLGKSAMSAIPPQKRTLAVQNELSALGQKWKST